MVLVDSKIRGSRIIALGGTAGALPGTSRLKMEFVWSQIVGMGKVIPPL